MEIRVGCGKLRNMTFNCGDSILNAVVHGLSSYSALQRFTCFSKLSRRHPVSVHDMYMPSMLSLLTFVLIRTVFIRSNFFQFLIIFTLEASLLPLAANHQYEIELSCSTNYPHDISSST